MNTYMLVWLSLDTQLSYMDACCIAVFVEANMKKGDLVKNIKTNDFYLVVNVSKLSNRDWVYVEPLCEGVNKWDRARNFKKVIHV